MKIQATNDSVWIIRDETPKESGGLLLPEKSRKKPHTGIIVSVGDLVTDKKIKNGVGKRGLWHSTVGQDLEYEDVIYLVLPQQHILGVV